MKILALATPDPINGPTIECEIEFITDFNEIRKRTS